MVTIDKKALKAQAHRLKPVVTAGSSGITANVLSEINTALDHHELIKIRIRSQDRAQRKILTEKICAETDAILIQLIGQITVLYRENPEKH